MAHLDHVAGAGPPGERLCKAGRQNRPPGARSLAKDASGTVTRVPAFPPAEDLQEELEMVINMQGHIYITLQDPFLVFRS